MNSYGKITHGCPYSRLDAELVAARRREQARIQVWLLIGVACLLGLAGLAYWSSRSAGRRAAANPDAGQGLSESTRSVLRTVGEPVEIRFYSVLDPGSAPQNLRDFAGRVDRLLSEYEKESQGRLTVTRLNAPGGDTAKAASADRIQPFNLDKGDACYLGLVLSYQGRKEVLPRVLPEWERALEPDITRALTRLIAGAPVPAPAVQLAPPPAAVLEQVKRVIPDPASVSLAEGTRILREQAAQSFSSTARELEARVKEAEQKFLEAKKSGQPDAVQQAALRQFQSAKAEQAAKLEQIADQLQAQTAALEYLKKK